MNPCEEIMILNGVLELNTKKVETIMTLLKVRHLLQSFVILFLMAVIFRILSF
jgi:hypothetical protein